MEEKKTVNKSIVILLLVICSLSLVAGVYANYRIIKLSNDNKETKETKEKEDNTKKEEEKVDVTEIHKEIMRKQIVINNYTDDDPAFLKSRIYEDSVLDKGKMLTAVLYSLQRDFKEYKELDSSKYPNITPNSEGATNVIEASKVKELYKDVFGEELDVNTKLPEKVSPHNMYNSEYDVFVEYAGYGGSCADSTQTYDFDYVMNGDNYYVYTAYAYLANCPFGVYKDINKIGEYKANGDFKLDASNYKHFNSYKITYTKVDGNYVFKSIEKEK